MREHNPILSSLFFGVANPSSLSLLSSLGWRHTILSSLPFFFLRLALISSWWPKLERIGEDSILVVSYLERKKKRESFLFWHPLVARESWRKRSGSGGFHLGRSSLTRRPRREEEYNRRSRGL